MATYALIPGAGGAAWYWHRVAPMLIELGHDVVSVDLLAADDAAGFDEYSDVVVDAIGDRTDLIVVGQSMGGYTATLVCDRVPVDLLILLNAMVPKVGESAGEWWGNVGHQEARAAEAARHGDDLDDMEVAFFHDVPEAVTAVALQTELTQSGTPFEKPWPLHAWPDVPTRFLLSRDDRFFPAEFLRAVVRDRLGFAPDEIDGGHLVALGHPVAVVERFESYRVAAGLS